MSIHKLGASLLELGQETNFGLATVHFDFSVVKVEAPKEFQLLGNELAPKRKEAAEDGVQHITARKLGALFQHWLPRTSNLIKAYGKRASEIASCRRVNPKPSQYQGLFADHVGIDGTSIWAAATSGPDAIAVHLLACLLARIWSRSEAISIWAELVSDRKTELAKLDETDPMYQHSIQLSKIILSREQLADWDASARSWLQAADEAMGSKHKQLMLILNNISLPVNTTSNLYQSVRQAWKLAMEATNKLIEGQPQSVANGSVLLGLSAWHIYPDMVVLQESQTPVKQHDSLVDPGGILTIGLQLDRKGKDGIYWSLPLGHLRYYGGSVMSQRCLNAAKNRVSASQLATVAVGGISKSWYYEDAELAHFLVKLWDLVSGEAKDRARGTLYWLGHLAQAVEAIMGDDELEKKQATQLLRLGRTQGQHFVPTESISRSTHVHNPKMFGLANLETCLSLIADYEDKIQILRRHVEEYQGKLLRDVQFLIRYPYDRTVSRRGEIITIFAFTTAVPVFQTTRRRRNEDFFSSPKVHKRWIPDRNKDNDEFHTSPSGILEEVNILKKDELCIINPQPTESPPFLLWKTPPGFLRSATRNMNHMRNSVQLDFAAGDMDDVSIFVVDRVPMPPDRDAEHPLRTVSLSLLEDLMENGLLHPLDILNYTENYINDPYRIDMLTSLRALVTIKAIYQMLPDATLELSAISTPLHEMEWVKSAITQDKGGSGFTLLPLNQSQTFSCIALFESGSFDVPASSLKEVMAMAAADSIYISAALLCDPCERPSGYEVRRIRGSIGKSGIAMLVQVENHKVREEAQGWTMVNHNPFDGKLEDSFHTATLHLSFTDYVLPIDVGAHGLRDFEIYFLESFISLHDKGEWIADLNLPFQLKNPELVHFHDEDDPRHEDCAAEVPYKGLMFTTIDDWNELLNPPEGVGIIRSTGNWLGRLAATCLSLQLGHQTIVLQKEFCWECIVNLWLNSRGNSELYYSTGSLKQLPPKEVLSHMAGVIIIG
ncbi:hypothetical protein F5Y10DRAFT_243558 [Nemania abortiva]|nr:hypothetical protein F5Y10DRAFT_243558 [Nemania abortiva]